MKVKPSEKLRFQTPIPTRIISNGEYDPIPQTKLQKKVEKEIKALAETLATQRGMTRREVLLSTSAISIGLAAMNSVFGKFFDVSVDELTEEKNSVVRGVSPFIFDVQTHMIKDDFHHKTLLQFARWANALNIKNSLAGFSDQMNQFKFPNFLREVFVDSDTDIALLSGAPFSNGNPLPNDLLNSTVEAVQKIFGEKILFANYMVNPTIPNHLAHIKKDLELGRPLSWKLFPMGDPLSPTGLPWRLDDEKLIYPFYEFAMRQNIKTICIHKGLVPRHFEKKYPKNWQAAQVDDLKKTCVDWPDLNFVIFHSALRPFAGDDHSFEMQQFQKTGYIRWTSDLIRIKQELGVQNIYAELGTSFASSCITDPKFCAAFLGTLLNDLGPEKIIWGTDSVWYGSPQWQIEAFRKFQIPEDMKQEKNWKVGLGEVDSPTRNAILGLNGARVFSLDPKLVKKRKPFSVDWIQNAEQLLRKSSHKYYGYHR